MEIRKERKERGEKWKQHYSSSHKILLVGEGDFSFSASIAKALGSATNMVATSHDSKVMLRIKHWSSEAHLEELNGLGCMVLHDVDVHDMNKQLKRQHKNLLSGFFQSASKMLTDGGEVHVAHRNDYPYNRWKLKELAKRAGLVLKECVEFRQSDYPGYHNKRGGGIKSNQKFPLKECFTFKFSLRDSSTIHQSGTSMNGCDDVSEASSVLSLLFLNDRWAFLSYGIYHACA